MALSPTSSRGGGLPSQWTVDDNGALNITLTGASGDHDFAHLLRLFNSDGSNILAITSSGDFQVNAKDASSHVLTLQVPTKQAFDVDSDNVISKSYPVMAGAGIHTAPADGAINAGECALWYDQTNGAAKLMVKAKQADSTVVTAAVALA